MKPRWNPASSFISMRRVSGIGGALLVLGGWAAAAQLPAGTQIQVRLTTALNTSTAKANQPFEAVVIAPVVVGERLAFGQGTKVAGHIKEVKAATQPDDQAVLALAFDAISDAAGKRASIAAKVTAIDNARESVDANGQIRASLRRRPAPARLDQGINKFTENIRDSAIC